MPGASAHNAPMVLVSEPGREHETFKYESSLFGHIRYNDDGGAIPDAELKTSPDTILTALCQLAACRTRSDRSLISLFDQTHQYFVGEATPDTPLVPSVAHTDRDDALWLCGTAIPRAHGVCETTLRGVDLEEFDHPLDPNELPMVVVNDLTTDPKYCWKPYCRPGSPARFYAAVPIRTHRGINIGVLCVFNTTPGGVWGERQSRIMRDLSRTVMRHLESTRLKGAERRSERMTRGIGSFMEGSSTLSSWETPDKDDYQDIPDMEGGLNIKQQQIQHDREQQEASTAEPRRRSSVDGTATQTMAEARTQTVRDGDVVEKEPDSTKMGTTTNGAPGTSIVKAPQQQPEIDVINHMFSKAANLIRESIEVEGCLFLDPGYGFSDGSAAIRHHELDPQRETASSSSSDEDSNNKDSSNRPHSSANDYNEDGTSPTSTDTGAVCAVLGFSTTDRSSINASRSSVLHGTFKQRFLAKLLRRYPSGHVFHFDANGELQSSDSSEEEPSGGATPQPTTERRQSKPWSRRNQGRSLLKTFPGARSVAFLPVWDSKRERYRAAGFAYTQTPTRVFTVQGELSYLRAFATLVAAESLRVETVRSEKAKSDALGSLSHELRSPLHGIVLGLELLDDTTLDVMQSNIAHMIATCSRTLTDTVDHLLDYSKVNNLTRKRKEKRKEKAKEETKETADASGKRFNGRKRVEPSLKALYKLARIDVLVEEVVESVFAGFNFQHLSIAQFSRQKTMGRDVIDMHRLDSMKAEEDLGSPSKKDAANLGFEQVSISLAIDHSQSWVFATFPGGLRRIIMNLFGNALKYTKHGSIRVSLDQNGSSDYRSQERMVNITVTDTGKGINRAFLQDGLFKPFSQEDPLSPGTGLGLSFVKQITTQLGGQISILSDVGIGTTVKVSLPLTPIDIHAVTTPGAGNNDDDDKFSAQVKELKGLRVRVLGFDGPAYASRKLPTGPTDSALVEHVCRDWLHMQVMTEHDAKELVPDLILRSEDSLSQSYDVAGKSPCVVVCANAVAAYRASSQCPSDTYEFTSQPIAPRKLAKTLSLVFTRWTEAQANPLSPVGPGFEGEQDEHGGTLPTHPPQGIVSRARRVVTPLPPTKEQASYFEDVPTFLLVDDNRINLKILVSYMNKLKRKYVTAANGQEALDAYKANPGGFSCILMDISMPVMDGFEATRQIRVFEMDNKLQPALIFALSGLATEDARKQSTESGLDMFLSKPVMLKELGAILNAHRLLAVD